MKLWGRHYVPECDLRATQRVFCSFRSVHIQCAVRCRRILVHGCRLHLEFYDEFRQLLVSVRDVELNMRPDSVHSDFGAL